MNFVPRKLANSRFFDPVGWSSLIFRPSFSLSFSFLGVQIDGFLPPLPFLLLSWLLTILHSEILQECVSLSFAETGVIDRKMLELANPLLLPQRYTWIKSQRSLSLFSFPTNIYFSLSLPKSDGGKVKNYPPATHTRGFPSL